MPFLRCAVHRGYQLCLGRNGRWSITTHLPLGGPVKRWADLLEGDDRVALLNPRTDPDDQFRLLQQAIDRLHSAAVRLPSQEGGTGRP